MLTRDGERVLEVLLIATSLALVLVFRSQFPLPDPVRISATGERGAVVPASVSPDRSRDVRPQLSVTEALGPVESFERVLTDAVARLADLESRITRC